MTPFEIPLSPEPQRFGIELAGKAYQMRFAWCRDAQSWTLDLRDGLGNELILGASVVTGTDIFGQYPHLAIPGALIAQTDHDANAVPTFENLGVEGRVYFVTLP